MAEVTGGPEVKSPASPYFPRLTGFSAAGSVAVEAADTFYLLLRSVTT
jgi:hypothetical protein